jgi:hypothetical protein
MARQGPPAAADSYAGGKGQWGAAQVRRIGSLELTFLLDVWQGSSPRGGYVFIIWEHVWRRSLKRAAWGRCRAPGMGTKPAQATRRAQREPRRLQASSQEPQGMAARQRPATASLATACRLATVQSAVSRCP